MPSGKGVMTLTPTPNRPAAQHGADSQAADADELYPREPYSVPPSVDVIRASLSVLPIVAIEELL